MKTFKKQILVSLVWLLGCNLPVFAQILVKDIRPFSASSSPEQLTNVNGTLYFVANDGVHGRELWKSDGTGPGTVLVKDIMNGSADGIITSLKSVNGKLFYAATNPDILNKLGGGETKLWTSDGTAAGTVQLKDGVNNQLESIRPMNFTSVGSLLFYTNSLALGGQSYMGICSSDGTDSPGTKIADKLATSGSGFKSKPSQLTEFDGKLYYFYNGELQAIGNAIDIKIVKDADPDPKIQNLTNSGNKLYFAAATKSNSRRLWTSDGTVAGTFELKDGIGNPAEAPNPTNLTDVNGTLYYSSYIAKAGYTHWGLFKSNGTDYPGTKFFGTFVLPSNKNNPLGGFDIPYESSAISSGEKSPSNFINVNGTLYFVYAGYLWKTNGTSTGTIRIANTLAPSYLTNVNGVLYFVNSGSSIHRTHPSTNSAAVVYNSLNSIANLTLVNNMLFFTLNSIRSTGNELYKFVIPKRVVLKLPK